MYLLTLQDVGRTNTGGTNVYTEIGREVIVNYYLIT